MAYEMLSFDLGSRNFKVSVASPDTQCLFDQGLNWYFGFNP